MKKYFIILALVFLFTGCTKQTGVINEKNAPGSLNTYNDSEVLNKLNQLKNEVKPIDSTKNSNQNKEQINDSKVELVNLAKDFNGVIMKTNYGDISIKFYTEESPITVNNFLNLAKNGFYDGTKFHRVIPDFMIQGGDPNSKDDNWEDDGIGGPGYKFVDEFNSRKLVKGSFAMANSGPNTNGSQFFIVTLEATPWLDGKHTNFGEVVSGIEVVESIEEVKTNEKAHPTEDVIIKSIELIKI